MLSSATGGRADAQPIHIVRPPLLSLVRMSILSLKMEAQGERGACRADVCPCRRLGSAAELLFDLQPCSVSSKRDRTPRSLPALSLSVPNRILVPLLMLVHCEARDGLFIKFGTTEHQTRFCPGPSPYSVLCDKEVVNHDMHKQNRQAFELTRRPASAHATLHPSLDGHSWKSQRKIGVARPLRLDECLFVEPYCQAKTPRTELKVVKVTPAPRLRLLEHVPDFVSHSTLVRGMSGSHKVKA